MYGKQSLVISRDLEVVLSGLDVISVVNDHVLDRIKVDGQGVLVVASDVAYFTYGRISILSGSGNLVGIVLRCTGDKLYYSVVGHFIGEISR
jgi:hypothetical protein